MDTATTITNNGNGNSNSNNNGNGNSNSNFENNFGLEIFNILLNLTESACKISENANATTDVAAATVAIKQNIIISPFLLESLLSLLYLGSDGKTAEELKDKLKLKRFPNNAKMANYYAGNLALVTETAADTQLEICSQILIEDSKELDAEFSKISQKYFLTSTQNQPADKMQPILGKSWSLALPSNASCLAMLAVNFKYKWFLPFSAYRSGLYDFHINSEAVKSIPMMLDNEMFVKFVELKNLDARAVELPYEHDDELSMLLILPNKRDGLKALETQLKDINLSELSDSMQMESVQLLLPKFKINFECCLREVLQKYGLSYIFTEDSNFKNLLSANSPASTLPVTDILHKVSIEVNESGVGTSSDAAILKPLVISNSIDTRQKYFRADHPFFFAVRNSDATFFMGHVTTF